MQCNQDLSLGFPPNSKVELRSGTAEVVSIKLSWRASCFFEGRLDYMLIYPHRATDSSPDYSLADHKMEDTQLLPSRSVRRPPLCLMSFESAPIGKFYCHKTSTCESQRYLVWRKEWNSTVKATWVWQLQKETELSRSAICFWIPLSAFYWSLDLKAEAVGKSH